MLRTLSRGQLLFDLLVPAGLLVLLAVPYSMAWASSGGPTVLFGMCVALAFWRLNPGIALTVAWVTAALQMLLGQAPDPTNLAIFIVLYATSAYGSRLVKWLGFASAFLGAAVIAAYTVIYERVYRFPGYYADTPAGFADLVRATLITFFTFLALFLLAWTLGQLTKSYNAARVSRRAQADAEAEKQLAEDSVMVEQERTRIARDMHDVVAHSLAVVIAQADGARYARVTDPDALDGALLTISTTAREALADVRILLGQLRHSQIEGPQPMLDDLDRLLDQMRAAGLDIDYRVAGERQPLGTGPQLAAYRIVQEALTNCLRHGDLDQRVTVVITWSTDRVTVQLENAVGTPTGEVLRPGHGLAGMRERAILVGGTLEAGAVGQHFVVTASIPRVGGQTGMVPVVTPGTLATAAPVSTGTLS